MTRPVLQLMSRQACCLCEDAALVLSDFVAQGRCNVQVIDVDQDIALAARYGMDVPVLLLNDEVCLMHRMTHEAVEKVLEAAC